MRFRPLVKGGKEVKPLQGRRGEMTKRNKSATKDLSRDTLVTHLGRDPAQQKGVVNPPVYRASTIVFQSLDELERSSPRQLEKGKIHYGRLGTPTVFCLGRRSC